jgi:glycosyltransferase involved in cell wall biosynthesis
MKILMITPYLPYPIVSGGQIRTYNLLKNLAPKHDITLMSFIRESSETQYIPELEKFCRRVITFKRTPHAWHIRNILLSGLTPYPFVVCLYLYRRFRLAVEQELKNSTYDLIHAETFYVMPNIPATTIPILLVEQVIEYLVYQQFTQMLPLLATPLKPLLYLDVAKIKKWERYYWKRATRLAAMSQEDKNFMLHLEPGLEINVIANGVDIPHFTKVKKPRLKHPTILFIGNFKWLPNRDAAKFLVNQIWPHIKSQLPAARLWIVGRNPTPDILSLAAPHIKVDGSVEDIRDAYAHSHVLLAPIRNGRGTKYKILEAMATRTPIIGTPLAVEGIGIQSGTHALVSDNPGQLADHTVKILQKPSLGRRLATNAFKFVSQDYSWAKISQELDRVYQELGQKQS